ncbi:nucleotide sugar dehydrogenase [Compostimonas suwonensis]|uniref:Nucleotide sugar dehydrogenase n=1 Tax=Compostimonas suwonensis TaxID=1048394 RepID=A0A2M9BWK8_9MICO|nr:nucleotide sugar dehydrogenase [Compostimonas suwonensis]PJJ62336.1 nucleotide sugar dehydrogenase [Compostimonas suwonensis]
MTTLRPTTRPLTIPRRSEWRTEIVDAPPEPAPVFDYDVAIVGLGYVGLPTALAFHHAGARVLALDSSAARRATIQAQTPDISDADHARLSHALGDDSFRLTGDSTLLRSAAAVVVCVPTPVDHHLIPDLAILRSACATVVAHATEGQLFMLTSTSYVGCTNDLLLAPLRARGFTIGTDVFVAFSAERIDPGSSGFAQEDVTRVMGGATLQCEEEADKLLRRYAADVHRVSSLAAAEMTKLLENTFRAVNIALANEFADICRALDVSVTDVIDAASTKPYGFMPFYPGPGVGGHCIPCDPHYLLWQLREQRIDAPVITQAMTQIAGRPTHVVDRVQTVLSERGIGIAGARILVVGVSYKADVEDLRESPALEILASLTARGAAVGYLDPHFASVTLATGQIVDGLIDPVSFSPDLVLVHTRHTAEDLSWLEPGQLIVDATYRSADLPERVLL